MAEVSPRAVETRYQSKLGYSEANAQLAQEFEKYFVFVQEFVIWLLSTMAARRLKTTNPTVANLGIALCRIIRVVAPMAQDPRNRDKNAFISSTLKRHSAES
jgi:hypothetical protein